MTTRKAAKNTEVFVGKVASSVMLREDISEWLAKFVFVSADGVMEEQLDFKRKPTQHCIDLLEADLQRDEADRNVWRVTYVAEDRGEHSNKYVEGMDKSTGSSSELDSEAAKLFPEESSAPKANAPVTRREDPVQANIRRSVAVNKSVDAAPTIMDFMLMQPGGTDDEINTIGNLDASTALWARTINTMTDYLEAIQLRKLKDVGD
tara:strand:+ start:193 stop:810 length:618 start_codon:yes stop_codon:yes gene_type:complete